MWEATERRVSPRPSVFGVSLRQSASEAEAVSRQSETSAQSGSVSGIRKANSAIVLIVIVICVVIISTQNKSGIQSKTSSSY
jgi:hypothetical protein